MIYEIFKEKITQRYTLETFHENYFILLFTRKYFCKNGYIWYNFDWTKVYFFLSNFVLKYKFSFNLKTKRISFKVVQKNKQLENKFHFLKMFIKLNKSFKWIYLDYKKLKTVLDSIQKNTLKALVKQS